MNDGEGMADARAALQARHPHLAQGDVALRARDGAELTPFDGLVGPGKDLELTGEGAPKVSASRLELLGECPLAYFFHYVLGVRPPKEITWDPATWLDPLEEGSFLHDLFRRFTEELLREGREPVLPADRDRLLELMETMVKEKEAEVPPPNDGVRDATRGRFREAAVNFIDDLCTGWAKVRPVMVETLVGDGERDAEPVTMTLPDGRAIRISGKIDRLDRREGAARPTFTVIDYKTGRPPREAKDPFLGGRHLQNVIYLHLAGALVRRLFGPTAVAEGFTYLCPGVKGKGKPVSWSAEALLDGPRVIGLLCDIVAGGVFLPSGDRETDSCDYCDYAAICGASGHSDERVRGKLSRVGEGRLDPHRRLRGVEP
jgi:ATP-dependent helicase/nuclease subunit B